MNRIREARKQAGIKQTDLCARLGISQGALSGWENGKYEPGRSGWLSLSEVLGVSVDYLMGNSIAAAPAASALSSKESQLVASFSKLNDEGQEKVLVYIEDLCRTGIYKRDYSTNLGAKQA